MAAGFVVSQHPGFWLVNWSHAVHAQVKLDVSDTPSAWWLELSEQSGKSRKLGNWDMIFVGQYKLCNGKDYWQSVRHLYPTGTISKQPKWKCSWQHWWWQWWNQDQVSDLIPGSQCQEFPTLVSLSLDNLVLFHSNTM